MSSLAVDVVVISSSVGSSGMSSSTVWPGIASLGTLARTGFPVRGLVTCMTDFPGFAFMGMTVRTLVILRVFFRERVFLPL